MQYFSIDSDAISLPRGAWAKAHRLNVSWNGRPIAALSQGEYRAYLFPVYTPAGFAMTSESPIDHPHQQLALDRCRSFPLSPALLDGRLRGSDL